MDNLASMFWDFEPKNINPQLEFKNLSISLHTFPSTLNTSEAHYEAIFLPNIFFSSLTLILCALTYPLYTSNKSIFLVRKLFATICGLWWLIYPLVNAVTPIKDNVPKNFAHFLGSFILMSKSIEWGFTQDHSTAEQQKIVRRRSEEFKEKEDLDSKLSIYALSEWIFIHFTTLRGIQLPWGQYLKHNRNGFIEETRRLILCHCLSLLTLIPILYIRDFCEDSPTKAIKTIFGIYHIFGLSFFARGLHTIAVITSACATIEAANSTLAVLGHIIHPVISFLRFPAVICEFWNPIYYPPLFSDVLRLDSVASFWGKTWHQTFRRSFVVCGSTPAMKIAKGIGAPKKLIQIAALFGAFTVSGFLHSYPMYLMFDPSKTDGNISTSIKFKMFICFPLQALGILLEPIIIPLVPRRIGGGRLWTAGFLCLTLSLVTVEVCKVGRLSSLYKNLGEWTLKELFVPAFFSPMIL
ncbi:membrane bound O-acyl transferase family-domain-containing protein [Phakopsora pachyrhizi]|uniref:Membrane bound O-acyl transferase family-domain-containing protein n=1 Tax=Phakopsora pachyrhizi TaxID=170000 RepID=A0AAV0BCJ1_PHAPC|nr:membrane bound O-acyl transferase family-domain-containing protein [Phakopsora pachyrhizi]CAH7685004.1 membrane bound O-acyl transferase family-domain-containing protein [Phakopsora pachyrhizi]